MAAGHGTGFVVRNGLVLTAAHVVADPRGLAIVFSDGHRVPGTVAWVSQSADIAAIRAQTGDASAAPLSCRRPIIGEPIVTIGNPVGLHGVLSWGHVSALRTDGENPASAVLNVTAYAGSSGSPVFDANGHVIGVIDAIIGIVTMPTGMPAPIGYALMVPADQLCQLRV